jgi:hypothetical protein
VTKKVEQDEKWDPDFKEKQRILRVSSLYSICTSNLDKISKIGM